MQIGSIVDCWSWNVERLVPLLIDKPTIVPVRLDCHVCPLCYCSYDIRTGVLKVLVLKENLLICELVKQFFKTQGRVTCSYGSWSLSALGTKASLEFFTISSSSCTGEPTTVRASKTNRTFCKYSVTRFSGFLNILQLIAQAKSVSVTVICVSHVKKFPRCLRRWGCGNSWRNRGIDKCNHCLLDQLVMREPDLVYGF